MLKPGDPISPFDLPALLDGGGGRVPLAGIRSEPVGLFFYPGDLSFICPTEVTGLGKALSRFAAEKTSVLGVSVDDVESHRRWAAELDGVTHPLLADPGGEFAKACGVFDEHEQVAMRATFLLDKKRAVIFADASPINGGRGVDETQPIVRTYRIGRPCPADWEPGDAFGPGDRRC
jgi:peroxiredoxin (alkyl hydroperoxide reductase subunit C)